ncbi:hypothetical protein PIB30_068275 [Stylosanthes scabra]|uniref:Uncharacterized protein n=1 Tax=Stylosanthes scabra TaxID=79078 RepID=A0ABU6ZLI4_9FABA|nr:hypothetical protein [Stylosanthes scabra]
MTKKRSPRVFSQEEDLILRSTKKVKTRDQVALNQPTDDMVVVPSNEKGNENAGKVSYKDSLLTPKGPSIENIDLDLNDVNEDDPNPEDKWYNDDSVHQEAKAFDPCPVIPVSKEEFEEWCKTWHAALIIKVLGKRVHLAFMEQRLNRDWVKKGRLFSSTLGGPLDDCRTLYCCAKIEILYSFISEFCD